MGSALLEGAISAKAVDANDVFVCDAFADAATKLAEKCNVKATELADLVASSDTLLLCTKPADISAVLSVIDKFAQDRSILLISVAAGVTLSSLESPLNSDKVRVIRAMPNTPALISKGAAAFARGAHATDVDAATTRDILGSVGTVSEVKEHLLDAVTGLSGSGPAYVYTIIEALADGGVAAGLARGQALELAAQTVLGAAAMVQETGLHPAVLKDMVTSPGGTTITGLRVLEESGIRSACIEAVQAATNRSQELGQS